MQELLRSFSGMRFEVLGGQQVLFFVASLYISPNDSAELRQMSVLSPGFERILANWEETIRRTTAGRDIDASRTPIPVHLRGYDDRMSKAVHLSGGITHVGGPVWKVEKLAYERSDNDRAYFRQITNVVGRAAMIGQVGPSGQVARATSVAAQCSIQNISAGGVCIRSKVQYPMGAILQLRFNLFPEQKMPAMRCQVLRVTQGTFNGYEYGCKFLQLSKPMENALAESILELQRRMRQR